MGAVKSLLIFLLWFFLIMNTMFFIFQLYVLTLDEDASEGLLKSLYRQFDYLSNDIFLTFVCILTNVISQSLVLSGNTYPAVFYSLISFSFLMLKLVGCPIGYLKSLETFSSYSIKDLKKSFQTSCFYNQNLLFVWINLCIVALLFQIYSNWSLVMMSVVLWLLSYCLFFFSVKFNLLVLEKTILVCIITRGIILLHDGPWYFFAATIGLFFYFSLEKTVIKDKFMSFKNDLILSTVILKQHYLFEVYLFFIMKNQSLLFLVLFIFFQNTLHSNIEAGVASCSNTLLEIFLITAGLVAKSAILGGVATGVLAGSALSDSATSTTVDPGEGWVIQRMQIWKQGFTSATKEGNILGKTCWHIGRVKPPVYRGTQEIDLEAAFELVSKGLETEKQANLASWMTGIECTPYSKKKELDVPIKKELHVPIKRGPSFFNAMSKKDK